jgi:hypothetical protein
MLLGMLWEQPRSPVPINRPVHLRCESQMARGALEVRDFHKPEAEARRGFTSIHYQ